MTNLHPQGNRWSHIKEALASHVPVDPQRVMAWRTDGSLCEREAQNGLLDELPDDLLPQSRRTPVAILPTDLPNTGRGGLACSDLGLARRMIDAIMTGDGMPFLGDDSGWPPKLLRLAKQHVWLHRGLFHRVPASPESAWALAHWTMRQHALSLAAIRVALLTRPATAVLMAGSHGVDVATVIGSMPLPPEDAPASAE